MKRSSGWIAPTACMTRVPPLHEIYLGKLIPAQPNIGAQLKGPVEIGDRFIHLSGAKLDLPQLLPTLCIEGCHHEMAEDPTYGWTSDSFSWWSLRRGK